MQLKNTYGCSGHTVMSAVLTSSTSAAKIMLSVGGKSTLTGTKDAQREVLRCCRCRCRACLSAPMNDRWLPGHMSGWVQLGWGQGPSYQGPVILHTPAYSSICMLYNRQHKYGSSIYNMQHTNVSSMYNMQHTYVV